jgi:hypothetical protein
MPVTSYIKLKAYNPDLLIDAKSTFLTQDQTSGVGSIVVEKITNFNTGDYLLIGEFGQETAEIKRVHVSTSPSGNTITLNTNTVEAHSRGEKVYLIDRNQVEFSRATTLAGTKTILSTVSITPSYLYTIYEDITNTTGFGFYRFKNGGDTTYTNYSESIPYAGYGTQTLKSIFDTALTDLGYVDELGQPLWTGKISREAAFRAVVDAQNLIARRRYRWSYLTNFDVLVSEISTGQDVYALPSATARLNGRSMILGLRINGREDLKYVDKTELNLWREGVIKNSLGSDITGTGDTTVTLSDSSDFSDSGSIQVINDDGDNIDSIDYTDNDRSTNVLSGVTGIAEAVTSGALVWQKARFGEPSRFTVFESNFVLDYPPSTDWAGHNLLADLYEKPTVVNDLADEAQFPATVIAPFVKYKLELLKYDGDETKAAGSYTRFQERLQELEENENNGQRVKFRPNRQPSKTTNLLSLNSFDQTTDIGD